MTILGIYISLDVLKYLFGFSVGWIVCSVVYDFRFWLRNRQPKPRSKFRDVNPLDPTDGPR